MNEDDIPTKDLHETLGFCVNCDATRVIGKHGQCINCGSESIYRNGVAAQLQTAKEKYEKSKQRIIEEATHKYSKEVKLNGE